MSKRRRSERGFTLIELLAVVVIIAILATLLIPSFFKESRKAKSRTEATSMLAEIALKQESYKSEVGVFLSMPSCPATLPATDYLAVSCTGTTAWTSLRIMPKQNKLRCQYTAEAGTSSDLASPPAGWAFTAPTTSSWYWVHAKCDGDGAGAAGVNAEYFMTSVDSTVRGKNEGS
jgi:prepilin-type N-terminal cleavage/methylation domain-containing protein